MRNFIMYVMLAAAVFAFAPAASALEVGSRVENFTLTDMEGHKVSLSDFKGKTVILNFWATWCPPCRAEMPEFDAMDKELKKSKEAVLLAVNMTDGMRDTKDKVAKFLKKEGYGMRVLLDTESKAADIFSIRGIPTTVVIDGKGMLRGQIVGGTTKDAVMKIVKGIK